MDVQAKVCMRVNIIAHCGNTSKGCKVNGGIMKHLRFLTSLSWTVDRGVQYPCGKTTTIINLSKSQVLVEVLHFP